MIDPAKHIAIAIDQWIREVDARDLTVEQIEAAFQDFCKEMEISQEVARQVIVFALED